MDERTSKKQLIEAIINHRLFCFIGMQDKFIMRLWLHWQLR